MHKHIIVAGDPIRDVFRKGSLSQDGRRFNTNEIEIRDGGALNCYRNLAAITKGKLGFLVDFEPRGTLDPDYEYYRLERLIGPDGLMLEIPSVGPEAAKSFYAHGFGGDRRTWIGTRAIANHVEIHLECRPQVRALVLSDYNKGLLNHHSHVEPRGLPDFDFCLVDSRHRTLNLEFLKTSKFRIWRATGSELDFGWAHAAGFDYIVHTNGPFDVWLLRLDGGSYTSDGCFDTPTSAKHRGGYGMHPEGAGDTFDAALTAYLAQHWEPGRYRLKELLPRGIEFAIQACQRVVHVPYTTITDLTL